MAKAKDFQSNGEDSIISDMMELAAAGIFREYGHKVAVKGRADIKFGRNANVDVTEIEITRIAGLSGANEIYQTDNTITHISSSDLTDTQPMQIKGYTLADGKFTEVVQTVTLQGQTKTPLDTPLARSVRARNMGSTDLAGTVYVYEDVAETGGVPNDLTACHLVVAENNQSQHALDTVPDGFYYIVTGLYAFINKATQGTADIRFSTREFGGVFQVKFVAGVSDSVGIDYRLEPYGVVPPNSDLRITAEGSAQNLDITAGFSGVLAEIINT